MGRHKKELSVNDIFELLLRHAEGESINILARDFGIRTQSVTLICGRRRPEYDSKYNPTW